MRAQVGLNPDLQIASRSQRAAATRCHKCELYLLLVNIYNLGLNDRGD